MITRSRKQHNAARLAILLTAGISLGLYAACGGAGQDAADRARPPRAATSCALLVSDSVLHDFLHLVDRVESGANVSVREMTELADRPLWRTWRRSFFAEETSAETIGHALFVALRGTDALPEDMRGRVYRNDLVRNYRQTANRREQITAFLAQFTAAERACDIATLLRGYLTAADLPDTLRLEFVVGMPEIRLFEGVFLVDAGLAWASGQEQLVRFLASTLYKQRTLVDGPIPNSVHGSAILLHSLRVVRNEAVAAYIDDLPEVTFDGRHELLAAASFKPETVFRSATRTLSSLDGDLTLYLAKPSVTDEEWLDTYRLFVGAQSWQTTGWFMARTIVDRLGIEQLQQVGRSVPDFFAAYQNAATSPPRTAQAEPGSPAWYLAAAPALSESNWAWLEPELRRLFP